MRTILTRWVGGHQFRLIKRRAQPGEVDLVPSSMSSRATTSLTGLMSLTGTVGFFHLVALNLGCAIPATSISKDQDLSEPAANIHSCNYSSLASFGTILMAVSLATGFLMEQSLRIICQTSLERLPGTLAIATRLPVEDRISCGFRKLCSSPVLRAAMVGDALDSSPPPPPAPVIYDCPTGICTFLEQLGATTSQLHTVVPMMT